MPEAGKEEGRHLRLVHSNDCPPGPQRVNRQERLAGYIADPSLLVENIVRDIDDRLNRAGSDLRNSAKKVGGLVRSLLDGRR